jgi:hypothetical protein
VTVAADAINDEILRIKRELAARFGNDLDQIIADAKTREQRTITLPPRRWIPEPGPEKERIVHPTST